ncbi:WG containing repeat-containing protein [Chitinophaga costaii]|uniref:WG containing repeat-containing protein n=1 Tax=Chitinophaga costaii TaxID=1335309 RepID=A0A1C4FXT9_9BACT|nr:WG repeat-containing protein [Chitinophaga costaii]PUZ20904.1 WG repeat-containing protein [Chitinophaga costaii]SCC60760.1 WG containing repeat-containing protein [Chitinophaga costaii]
MLLHYHQTKILLPVMLCSFLFGKGKIYTPGNEVTSHLIPWLTTGGKYGYADNSGKMFIHPQFDDAQLFQHGFAVVGKNNKYGVINTEGKFVIPMAYPFVEISKCGNFTWAVLKKEHNAWWQFWHWKLLPQWNILGGKSGPFLVTKVPRAQWSVMAIPGRKTLFVQRRMDDKGLWGNSQYWKKDWQPNRTPPADISIRATDTLIAVSNVVFHLGENNKLIKINRHFQYFTASHEMMVQIGENRYQIINEKGKPVNSIIYSKEKYLTIQDEQNAHISIPITHTEMPAYPVMAALFKNSKGQYFLPPNFTSPFPHVMQAYNNGKDTLTAAEILKNAVLINAIPNSMDFLIISSAGHDASKGWMGFIIKKDGSWNTKIPLRNGVKAMLPDGRIVYNDKENKGVLDTDHIFHSMPLSNIVPCQYHHDWYMGKDTASGKYGVYDVGNKRWQVMPKYNYLQHEIAPGIAIYTIHKQDSNASQKEWYGLLNIDRDKAITPPEYDRINADGRVWKQVNGNQMSFYINPETGDAYRDK